MLNTNWIECTINSIRIQIWRKRLPDNYLDAHDASHGGERLTDGILSWLHVIQTNEVSQQKNMNNLILVQ